MEEKEIENQELKSIQESAERIKTNFAIMMKCEDILKKNKKLREIREMLDDVKESKKEE